jgi:L-iditol 2-dehydrogenase
MRALLKYASGDGHVEVRDVAEPICGPNQVKVAIAFCGVCGTDIHVLHDTFRNYPPVILGHEFAGTVVEVGAEVSGVLPGTRVAVLGATAVTCGACRYCRSGYFIFCSRRRGMGHGVDGAFARYVVVRPDQLYRLPDGMTFEEGALSEPFAAVVQAVTEVACVQAGQTALVSGPGPIGLLAVKLLVSLGVHTIVAGTPADRERLESARTFGAARAVNVAEEDLTGVVLDETAGVGVDHAFECAGHPTSVVACLESLRPLGRHTQVGICGREMSFPIDRVFYKGLTIAGSICYTAETWRRMFEIFAEGKCRLHELVSHKLPLSEWQRGFDLCLERTATKVLLYPED